MRAQATATPAKLADDPLIPDSEVAALLGVSHKTVTNWRNKGEGPRWCKLGKRAVRYRLSAVEEFIAAGTASKAA